MISRHPSRGQKLDVSGLNEITVLIDRSETVLTEVAINSWSPGLDGPPHAHERKEQNFLVTAGRGDVVIGKDRFPASPGDFFYVPAGVVHQTINLNPNRRLDYFLFNAFLDSDKEGHASFAAHIDLVKETRRQQAVTQRADAGGGGPAVSDTRRGRKAGLPATGTHAILVGRADTARCEALAWNVAPGTKVKAPADQTKEQTLFVYAGDGTIRLGTEQETVKTFHTLYAPAGTAAEFEAGKTGMVVISFGTILAR